MEKMSTAVCDMFPKYLRSRKSLVTLAVCTVSCLCGLPCVTRVSKIVKYARDMMTYFHATWFFFSLKLKRYRISKRSTSWAMLWNLKKNRAKLRPWKDTYYFMIMLKMYNFIDPPFIKGRWLLDIATGQLRSKLSDDILWFRWMYSPHVDLRSETIQKWYPFDAGRPNGRFQGLLCMDRKLECHNAVIISCKFSLMISQFKRW